MRTLILFTLFIVFNCSLVAKATEVNIEGESGSEDQFLDFMTREIESRKTGGDFVYMFHNRHEIALLLTANPSNQEKLPSRVKAAQMLFDGLQQKHDASRNPPSGVSVTELVKAFIENQGQYKARPFLVGVDIEANLAAIEVDGVREDGTGTRYWILAKLTADGLWKVIDSSWILVWD